MNVEIPQDVLKRVLNDIIMSIGYTRKCEHHPQGLCTGMARRPATDMLKAYDTLKNYYVCQTKKQDVV